MRRLVPIAILLTSLAVTSSSESGDKPPEKFKVTLVAILGSEEGTAIDKRLEQIAAELKKNEPQLKSFKIHSMTVRDIPVRDKSLFNLIDDKTATVAIKHGLDENDRVAVGVTPPEQKEIVYRSVRGKFMPFVTNYQTKDRQQLIFAVRVESK